VPYVFKKRRRHTCWTPLGLLVPDGSIWQCGKCKKYWMRDWACGYSWTVVSERWARLVAEREESNGRE